MPGLPHLMGFNQKKAYPRGLILIPVFSSPIKSVWMRLLTHPEEEKSQQLRTIFSASLDPSDLQQMGFTTIHRIVLKLTSIKLRDQLQLSSSEIDIRCSLGLSPLMWAVLRSDSTSVRTLIDFGADPEVRDNLGRTCVHYACTPPSKDGLASLCTILKDPENFETRVKQHRLLNYECNRGLTALSIAANYNLFGLAQFLLDRGAKNSEKERQAVVGWAVESNSHETLQLLLDHGMTRPDYIDPDGQGILHMAAIVGDLRTIGILTKARICGAPLERKDMYGNTPLRSFFEVRKNYRSENDVERKSCLEAFTQLLESVVPDVDGILFPDSNFRELEDSSSGAESEEEVFFDTQCDMVPLVQNEPNLGVEDV